VIRKLVFGYLSNLKEKQLEKLAKGLISNKITNYAIDLPRGRDPTSSICMSS
jgi:hypothetical protein